MERYPIYPPGLMRRDGMMNMNMNNTDMHRHENEMSLAQTHIPMQQWREIYERDKALMRGTIFCELDKPFRGSNR